VQAVLADFMRLADDVGLMGFERPRGTVLDTVDW
jgi:hypothetical protein